MVGSKNSHNGRVLRVGQTGDQLIGVMLVIVIAAGIGFIGTDVNQELDSNLGASLDGEDITVTNESFTATFSNNRSDYQVNDFNRANTLQDDERVFNATSGSELKEGPVSDYEWFTGNGTVRVFNGSNVANNTNLLITYNYTEKQDNFAEANDNISSGFTSAMSLTDVVFLVLMFSVILGALLAFRVRS